MPWLLDILASFGFEITSPEFEYFRRVVRYTIDTRNKTGVWRGDFLDLMTDTKKLSADCITAQAVLFLLAGYANTSSGLSLALHLLATHPHHQAALRRELLAAFKSSNNTNDINSDNKENDTQKWHNNNNDNDDDNNNNKNYNNNDSYNKNINTYNITSTNSINSNTNYMRNHTTTPSTSNIPSTPSSSSSTPSNIPSTSSSSSSTPSNIPSTPSSRSTPSNISSTPLSSSSTPSNIPSIPSSSSTPSNTCSVPLTLNYDLMQSLHYLSAVVDETLRLYPGGPIIERVCTKDYALNSSHVTLKTGNPLLVPVWSIQRDPANFTDPEQFHPPRFLPHNKHKIAPYTFMPFGVGPRSCVGQRFADMSIKEGLLSLLTQFIVSPCECHTQHPPPLHPRVLTLKTANDLPLNFTPITNLDEVVGNEMELYPPSSDEQKEVINQLNMFLKGG